MENDGEKKNLEVENLQLIDILSEDDFLVDSPLFDTLEDLRLSVTMENIKQHEGFKLFGAANSWEVENAAETLWQREQTFSPTASMEPGRPNYLRKSLAWDSAFFTSAGVLDSEELSIINKGFKTAEVHLLPGIQEDLWARRSADSDSTLDSDGFSLESLDVDLFEDIRASIHRSRKMSNVASASCKTGFGQAGIQNILSSKKVDVGSGKKVKSTPPFRRQGIGLQKLERIKKEVSTRPQIVQHTARSGGSNPLSLKLPKILGQGLISAGQTTMASLGADNVKLENKTAKTESGQGLMVSKNSCLGNSCSLTTRPTPPPKSNSSVSLIATKDSTSCTSNDSSAGAGSSKSSSNYLRRKTGSRITKLASSSFSINLLSMSIPSSSTSPASSMDGWSSESSSSTFTANQIFNNSEPSRDATTFRGVCLGNDATPASDLQNHSHDQPSVCHEIQKTRLPSLYTEKDFGGSGPVSAESTRNFRPSGLRMPSPKIGFFDEEQSMMPTVGRSLQFHIGVQSALPNIDEATNRKRQVKFQPARTLPETGNINLGSRQTKVLHPASGMRPRCAAPAQLQELYPSRKMSGTFGAMRNCLAKASKNQTVISPAVDRENCSKTRKVGAGEHDRRKVYLSSSLKSEGRRTKGILKNKMGIESRGQKDNTVIHSNAINPSKKDPEEANQHHLENNLHLLQENEKGNLSNFEDQVIGLSRYFGAINLRRDAVTELKGKRSCSHHHQFGDNYPENHSAPIFSSLHEHYLCEQQQNSPNIFSKPSPLSLPTTVEFISSVRTPLADKTSVCNRSGSIGLSAESTREKSVEKASIFPFPEGTDKENS